jgi:hypothetical protein
MVDPGSGINTVPMSSILTGLVSNLTYHYRVAASNHLGIAYGDDETFGIWQLDDINLSDSGAGSLREVISGAPAGSTIVMTNSGTLVLTSGELVINKDLTITGPGADLFAISGNNNSRVFNIDAGVTVEISGLTVRDGRGAQGAYGSGESGSSGGGIYNAGNLTLNECAVVNNQAGRGGTGITGSTGYPGATGGAGGDGGSGGGIHNHTSGVLVLTRCTLNGNTSGTGGLGGRGGDGDGYGLPEGGAAGGTGGTGGGGGLGGAICNDGTLTMDHCTVSGNLNGIGGNGGRGGDGAVTFLDDGTGGKGGNGGVGGHGGGVWNAGILSGMSCSIVYNEANVGGAGGYPGYGEGNYGRGTAGAAGSAGGISNSATATCVNTIVASNTNPSGPDDAGGTFISLGYNLIGITNGASGFILASNDLLNVEAYLEELADNGGPTLTHLPQQGSPAIDAGLISASMPVTDQRGFPRIFNGRADIGAVEVEALWPTVETLPATDVHTDMATLHGTVNPAGAATSAWFEWGSGYENRTAVVNVGSGTNAVPMSTALTGLVQNLTYHYRIAASNRLGIVSGDDETFGIWQLNDINLADSGAGSLREVISGAPAGSTIVMTNSGTLVLTSGELVISKNLTITGPGADRLAISGNNSSRVFNIGAGYTVEISGLTIRNGRAASGAGGSSPGASGSPGAPGGGIYNAGNLTLTGCTVVDNHAGNGGNGGQGAIADPGSPGGPGGAGGSGGGIYSHNTGTLLLMRCTLNGNTSGVGGTGGNGGDGTSGNDGGPGGNGGGGGPGGALYNAGMLTLDHCTVSGNQNGSGGQGGQGGDGGEATINGDGGNGGHGGTGGTGGGIWNTGTNSLQSCSIVYNAAGYGGPGGSGGDGGLWGDGDHGSPGANGIVGGISNSATAECGNTIVASNPDSSGPYDLGGTFISLGYNLIGTTNGTSSGFASASNDLLNVEALLEPLADNGGPTLTHLPQLISPVIHAGDTSTNMPATDQRGFARIFNGRADIGAVELQFWWPVVTTLPATNTAPSDIQLLSTVNPKGSNTVTWFEYGLAAGYGASTEMTHIAGDPDTDHAISSAPDLLPWMSYHYRAVASNRSGRVDGSDMIVTIGGPGGPAPALSDLSDIILQQGGSISIPFTMSPTGLSVQVTCNNPILLPDGSLVHGSSGPSGWLHIVPDPAHSGSAQIAVAVSDGMHTASRTFNLTVIPADVSQLLNIESQTLPGETWRLQVHDDGTASVGYEVEYRPDLSPTSTWSTAENIVDLGGGEYEIDLASTEGDTGFYRIKGFRVLLAGLSSGETATEEGIGTAGVVVEFNSIFSGTLGYTWTDDTGTPHAGTVEVNGTTAVIPLPAAFLNDDTGIGQLEHLALELDAGPGYVRSGTVESRITIEENDADWLGAIETECGMLGFTLTILKDNGEFNGRIQSEGFGFFPTNILVQLAFSENAFTAVATNISMQVFADDPTGFINHMDLRLDAANHTGETNVGPGRIEGEATLAVKVPGQPYLDAVQTGPFVLVRPPTAASSNEVPLQPVP